jgi:hypothetical protein
MVLTIRTAWTGMTNFVSGASCARLLCSICRAYHPYAAPHETQAMRTTIAAHLIQHTLPFGEAWHYLKPLLGGFWHNWNGFVGIVLAVSGVEAIANATSVMKLDRGVAPLERSGTPMIIS